MLEIADWISRGTAPVRIEELLPLTPYVRLNLNAEGTKGVIVLLNTGLSQVDTATVSIRAPQGSPVRLISVDDTSQMEFFDGTPGWGIRVHKIPAWSTVSLLLG